MNYSSGRNAFALACNALGLDPLPATQRDATDVLLRFIGYMSAVLHLRASTMQGYVAAVRYMWHRSSLRCDPSAGSPLPASLISTFASSDTRTPLFRRHFERAWLLRALTLSDDPVVPLALVVGFTFFLRVSEYCTVQGKHVLTRAGLVAYPDGIGLNIERSKKDQERRGSKHRRRMCGGPLCPLALLHRYLATRPPGPPDGPALVWRDGRPFTSDQLNGIIKDAVRLCGTDPLLYSSHSLRSGGVTAMHAAGATVDVLIREGRWVSIEGLLKYLRLDDVPGSLFTGAMLYDLASSVVGVPRPPPIDTITRR